MAELLPRGTIESLGIRTIMSSTRAPGSEPSPATGPRVSWRWCARALIVLVPLGALLTHGWDAAASSESTRTLGQHTPGQPVSGSLRPGVAHEHTLDLPANHYVDLIVRVPGAKLTCTLVNPDGTVLAARTPAQSPAGTATLTVITSTAGEHRITIEVESEAKTEAGSPGKESVAEAPLVEAPPTTFTITFETLRPASPSDRLDVEGEELYLTAHAANREGSDDGRHRAVAAYRRAVALFTRSGSAIGEAKSRHGLASVLRRLGELEAAHQELELAIPRWRTAQLDTGEADSRIALAVILRRLDRSEDALAQNRQARSLAERAGDRRRLARTWHNQGAVLKDLDRLAEAADAYERALALRVESGDTRGEASTRSNLGTLYERMGEYRRAAEQLDQALHLLEAAGSRRLEAPLNNLGTVYNSLGQPTQARIFFTRALDLARARGDRDAEARTLNNIGWSLQREGADTRAMETFDRALTILGALGDRTGQAVTLTNLARAHARTGDHPTARTLLQRALGLRRELDDRLGEATTLANLAESLRALGDIAGAREAAERARLLAQRADEPRTIAWALRLLGRLAQDDGRLALAHRRTAAAVDHIESLRSRTAGSAWRASLIAAKHVYYEQLIDIELERHEEEPDAGWHARAFATSERARARALLDTLTTASVSREWSVDPELLDRERRLGQKINTLARQREDGTDATTAGAASTQADLAETLAEHQLVKARLAATDPRFGALTDPATVDVTAAQALLDVDTSLIELALGEQQSAIWLIDQQHVRAARLPSRAIIEATSRNLWELLTARNSRPAGEGLEARQRRIARADRAAHTASVALGEMLLATLGEHLGNRRLVVATDGMLAYVPFSVLHNPVTGRPLIDDHEIVSVPSASALAAMREKTPRATEALAPVVVVAHPTFGSTSSQRAAGTMPAVVLPTESPPAEADFPAPRRAADGNLTSLPWTAREAEAIAALAGDGTRVFVGTQASRELVLAGGLAGARIVHLATHGIFDSEHPELSALVFSTVDAEGRPVDGHLRLHDIYNLQLDADLVVLSACQTALGRAVRGEGLVGLARGFMYAGATRVLASLWQVRDDTTAELMRGLYQRLLAGASTSSALRAAQLELRKRLEAPFFWAGFTLQGDWQ